MYVILEQEPDLQTRKKNLKNPQISHIIISKPLKIIEPILSWKDTWIS